MPGFLRQSTATTIRYGPFVSPADAYTAFTSASFAVKLSKNGGALAPRGDVTAIAYDSDGYFAVVLSATDTNTVGRLDLETPGTSSYVPMDDHFTVLSQAVYDVLFGSAAPTVASDLSPLATATALSALATATTSGFSGAASSTVAPSWYGTPKVGVVVAGSTASVVVLSGLPSGKGYVGTSGANPQRLYDPATGEARSIASQSYSSPNYTFTLGTGTGEAGPFSAAPTTGANLCIVP